MQKILSVLAAIGSFMRLCAPFFIGYAILVNLIAFIMYAHDKQSAKKQKWRTPERTLICIALLGGSVGAFAAMKLFRHKTKHLKFTLIVPSVMVLQIALILLCLFAKG